jgi:hypothetical protein
VQQVRRIWNVEGLDIQRPLLRLTVEEKPPKVARLSAEK